MSKVMNFVRNHFVEVIGFISIFLIIILISYLRIFRKTFTCELKEKEGKATIYQRYVVKQSNNKLKSIGYYYRATTPDKKEKKKIAEFYKSMISENKDKIYDNNIVLKYNDDRLILSYSIDLNEVKNNDVYKSASSFVKSVKASGFKCK